MVRLKGYRMALLIAIFTMIFPLQAMATTDGEEELMSLASSMQAPFQTEVIVRTVNQFTDQADVTDFIQKAVQYKVDVINMSVKQDEDHEVPSGYVFYDSDIAPIASGYESFDALEAVISEAHVHGIEVRAWIPQFHDQAAFNLNPSWQMHALVDGVPTPYTGANGSEYFVNPIHPGVQAYQRSIIAEVVENYAVDGVVLDWLRFDDYDMDVSAYTVQLFEDEYGYSPLDIDLSVDSPQRQEWNEWRTDHIGSYVQAVRSDIEQIKPGMPLGVYILPPEFIEVGQDSAKFKDDVDFVAPMAYFDDWGFPADWVYGADGILNDTQSLVGPQVELIPTLDNDWSVAEYQEVYGGIRDAFPEVTSLSFFAYGAWDESVLSDIKDRRCWPEDDWVAPVEGDYEAELPTPWRARNIGLEPGDVTYSGQDGRFEIVTEGTDIWGTQDQLNYIYRPLTGDGTMIVQVDAMNDMSDWAKAGIMIRESLETDAKHVDMLVTPVNGATFQYRVDTGGATTDQVASGSPSVWLMLERSGDIFTGSVSTDGQSWTEVGSTTVAMESEAYIGLAVSNPEDTGQPEAILRHVNFDGDLAGCYESGSNTVTAEEVGGEQMPNSWAAAHIGYGSGQAEYTEGEFQLSSLGTDLWGTEDGFHYVYQTLQGDGTITARVSSMAQMSEWAKTGVMIRESLDADAKHVDMLVTPSLASYQSRVETGGGTSDATMDASLPLYVKLVRTGDHFTGLVSTDSITWERVGGGEVTMQGAVCIGLAISNPGDDPANLALVDQVEVMPFGDMIPPTAPVHPQIHEVTDATVELAWLPSYDDVAVAGYEVSYDDTVITTIGSETTIDGLAANTSYSFELRAVDYGGNRSEPTIVEAKTKGMSLIRGHDWSNFSGAVANGDAVLIRGLGRGIIPLGDDGSREPTPNSPINLRGPSLQVTGDFSVSATMLTSTYTDAYLQLYGTLPIIQDEWRQEGKWINLGLKRDGLLVEVYDGQSAEPLYTETIPRLSSGEVELTMTRLGEQLQFYLSEEKVVELNDPGIFDDGRVYFGADADVGESFLLEALYAKPEGTASELIVVDPSFGAYEPEPASLRLLAEQHYPHLRMGTAATINALMGDEQYAETLAKEFNMITPENEMKFQFIHPQRDQYAFAEMDTLMAFAEAHGIAVHGHTMAWSEALPRWVTDGGYSAAELEEILVEHTTTVVSRYPQIMSWDIINEPMAGLNTDDSIRSSVWYDTLGESYIDIALHAAHAANPDAKLYINEYWIEEDNTKSQAVYDLIVRLQERGVPIHGVGFQMHEDLTDEWDPVSAETFQAVAEKFAQIGIEVRVSEMDMNIHKEVTPAVLQEHGAYYRSIIDMVKSFEENGIRFNAFSMWGFTDRYSSLQPHHAYDDFGNGLIFDEGYAPKPAYQQLIDALMEAPPASQE